MIKCSNNKHQFLFLVILIALILLTNNAIKAEYTKVDNNKSLIVFHDGLFDNGLPYNTFIDDGKIATYSYGNWRNNKAYSNFASIQIDQKKILTQRGLRAKDVLKGWGVKDYKLGKKKSFKSSGSPAIIRMTTIDGLNCFVAVSKFGIGDAYNLQENRTSLDGFVCKFDGDFTFEEAMNFVGCIELKGVGNDRVGKEVDPDCTEIN
jgi:hypothetical protein|tara:strand:- start:872 stop:1489 length:618 start_codon:yes stop_codon:yes gene_type:complete